jgi:hypothetical protein
MSIVLTFVVSYCFLITNQHFCYCKVFCIAASKFLRIQLTREPKWQFLCSNRISLNNQFLPLGEKIEYVAGNMPKKLGSEGRNNICFC